jgi:tripartite ATP-independent transporter DctM subunit
MEWWLALILLMGMMMTLMFAGVPVAISFLLTDIVGALVFLGGESGLRQLVVNLEDSLTSFSLLPVPLFIIMGEVMFQSRMGFKAIDVIDQWIGRLPGRLSLVAIITGTIFATMSGSTMASAAILGSLLCPEMERRGYHRSMSLGPIMGAGGLAMLIPPSALAILLAAICNISVGGLLVASIIPGFLVAFLYAAYIIGRCWLQPELAPSYPSPAIPIKTKLRNLIVYVVPLGLIIFLVMGLVFLGIATPSESAALGTAGSLFLALAYGRMNGKVIKESIIGSVRVTSMMFMIIIGSTTFSQILAFSGASAGLIGIIAKLDIHPILILICMQIMLIALGCLMDNLSMVMIAIPIYLPIIEALKFDPIWFAVMTLINMELGNLSPPFGLLLFVMRGMAPPGTTMMDVYRAAIPFVVMDILAIAGIMLFPSIALYLPSLLK